MEERKQKAKRNKVGRAGNGTAALCFLANRVESERQKNTYTSGQQTRHHGRSEELAAPHRASVRPLSLNTSLLSHKLDVLKSKLRHQLSRRLSHPREVQLHSCRLQEQLLPHILHVGPCKPVSSHDITNAAAEQPAALPQSTLTFVKYLVHLFRRTGGGLSVSCKPKQRRIVNQARAPFQTPGGHTPVGRARP